MENIIRFRHNVMHVNSLLAFERIRGGMNQNCKDVYFVRLVGANEKLAFDIRQMDERMTKRMADGQAVYQRIQSLPALSSQKQAAFYEARYQEWLAGGRQSVSTGALKGDLQYAGLLGRGIAQALRLYFSDRQPNASIEKNFAVKLLFWHDMLLSGVIKQWNGKMSVKLALSNIVKKQEYLFSYLLTLLGYDVLLIQSEADISEQEEALLLSRKICIGDFSKIDLPAYHREEILAKIVTAAKPVKAEESVRPKSGVCLKRPSDTALGRVSVSRTEKSFEQLALLASSVVLIAIHDAQGGVIGTGSGIMIGKDGYILTNSHVASGGRFYSVRVEEDETVYSTDELIKYHSVLDLAVLRIEKKLNPLPIYSGEKKLVRGQKVVAIGSPLGLFNSVSDGIISGFRKIDGVDMIQFTAPTSHGSSGGALLNMYGEVIGISTAGFDNAQNINLAVGYESIRPFIRGFA